jgi:hypothetical protein
MSASFLNENNFHFINNFVKAFSIQKNNNIIKDKKVLSHFLSWINVLCSFPAVHLHY